MNRTDLKCLLGKRLENAESLKPYYLKSNFSCQSPYIDLEALKKKIIEDFEKLAQLKEKAKNNQQGSKLHGVILCKSNDEKDHDKEKC